MINFFQWKEKWETVASEKEPSFGASEEKAGGSDDKGKAKQNTENKARDKSDGETPKKQLHLSAAELFSDRYPDYFADLNNLRSKTESRIVLSVLSIVALGVIVAWIFWQEQYFRTDGDLVYYMGLTGGILLLIAALYALRKRVKLFSKIGNMATWYYVHLTAGVIGPVLIIFHTSFSLKALNSTVALISMLCVIASGIFGRYIYTRIGYNLHRQLIAIRTTEERLAESMLKYRGDEIEAVEKSLSILTASAITTPRTLFRAPARFFTLRARAAKCYIESAGKLSVLLKRRAIYKKWDKKRFRKELASEKKHLREHVNALVSIGQSHFYERLLVGWRIFHIPLLFILFISGSVHVLAIHLY